jgi:hypothetical protein
VYAHVRVRTLAFQARVNGTKNCYKLPAKKVGQRDFVGRRCALMVGRTTDCGGGGAGTRTSTATEPRRRTTKDDDDILGGTGIATTRQPTTTTTPSSFCWTACARCHSSSSSSSRSNTTCCGCSDLDSRQEDNNSLIRSQDDNCLIDTTTSTSRQPPSSPPRLAGYSTPTYSTPHRSFAATSGVFPEALFLVNVTEQSRALIPPHLLLLLNSNSQKRKLRSTKLQLRRQFSSQRMTSSESKMNKARGSSFRRRFGKSSKKDDKRNADNSRNDEDDDMAEQDIIPVGQVPSDALDEDDNNNNNNNDSDDREGGRNADRSLLPSRRSRSEIGSKRSVGNSGGGGGGGDASSVSSKGSKDSSSSSSTTASGKKKGRGEGIMRRVRSLSRGRGSRGSKKNGDSADDSTASARPETIVTVTSCRSDGYYNQKAPGSTSKLPRKAPSNLKLFHELAVGLKDAYTAVGQTPTKPLDPTEEGAEQLTEKERRARLVLWEFIGNIDFVSTQTCTRVGRTVCDGNVNVSLSHSISHTCHIIMFISFV